MCHVEYFLYHYSGKRFRADGFVWFAQRQDLSEVLVPVDLILNGP